MVSQLEVLVRESLLVGSEVLWSAEAASLETLSWHAVEDGSANVASLSRGLSVGELKEVLDESWGVGFIEFEGNSALSLSVLFKVKPDSWVSG